MVNQQIPADADHVLQLWPKSLVAYDVTLATPAENLALDEALLAAVEADQQTACLRFWESKDRFIVLGRSNRAETEVEIAACEQERIPILRRASGGGTVLVGPGCLCYSLVLPLTEIHRALGISRVTAELMERTARGLRSMLPEVKVCGTSDLVWRDRKFSGNAQRWQRRSFIHHGTLLYDFNLSMLGRCLSQPSRQPDYRQSRGHLDFVDNVPLSAHQLRECLLSAWNAWRLDLPEKLLDQTQQIATWRHHSMDWNR
jgi:lipoate-protein ligase A